MERDTGMIGWRVTTRAPSSRVCAGDPHERNPATTLTYSDAGSGCSHLSSTSEALDDCSTLAAVCNTLEVIHPPPKEVD